jgi:hypothetical protein
MQSTSSVASAEMYAPMLDPASTSGCGAARAASTRRRRRVATSRMSRVSSMSR